MNTEWKLVPVEPTDEMEVAAENDYEQTGATFPRWKSAYAAMLNAAPPAPTSHPIPTGATGERDWELACDNCNGSGHVFVKHQVAERETDVQEFKEECGACEGRGFNIAFEDIPGIAEYVKSCRADATVATEGEKDEQAFDAKLGAYIREWLRRHGWHPEDGEGEWEFAQRICYEAGRRDAAPYWARTYEDQDNYDQAVADAIKRVSARIERAGRPAAGDALDAKRYRWLRDPKIDAALVLDKRTGYVPEDESVPGVGGYHTYEYRAGEELDAAIDAAIAQQSQRKEA